MYWFISCLLFRRPGVYIAFSSPIFPYNKRFVKHVVLREMIVQSCAVRFPGWRWISCSKSSNLTTPPHFKCPFGSILCLKLGVIIRWRCKTSKLQIGEEFQPFQTSTSRVLVNFAGGGEQSSLPNSLMMLSILITIPQREMNPEFCFKKQNKTLYSSWNTYIKINLNLNYSHHWMFKKKKKSI